MRLSVVIPTLNEAENIGRLLRQLETNREVELIIVDGGSLDSTVEVVLSHGARVVKSTIGRGVQFNVGAKESSGKILLFLHADTLLPKNAFKELNRFFSDESHMIGTFRIRFSPNNWLLDLISVFCQFDTIFTSYGDQGIVIRRELFNHLKGFPQWPLFEDVKLLQKARRVTKIHKLSGIVTSSSRRFEENGVLRQLLWNSFLMILYLLGITPQKLSEMYRRKLS